MNFQILINDVDLTEYVPMPFTEQLALDESLDMGQIKLLYTDINEPFKPFTKVEIRISQTQESGTYNISKFYFVSGDEVVEIIETAKFNHSIMLVEQSKWLERFTGIVKTNTTPLIKDYSSAKGFIPIMVIEDDVEMQLEIAGKKYTTADLKTSPYNIQYKNPFTNGILPIMPFNLLVEDLFGEDALDNIELVKFDIYRNDELIETINNGIFPQYINVLEGGTYELYYTFKTTSESGDDTTTLFMQFGVLTQSKLPSYSIADVVDNLLKTCETLYSHETPRFRFNSTQKQEYSKILAPDFSLIGTLWECLSEVGTFIHCIPRLKNNEIYFDKLGSVEKTAIDLSNYCSNGMRFDIEQYATQLDCVANNIVNIDDKDMGTMIEPFNKGYKTVRSETGVAQLTDDNIFIETKEPIEEILSVECGYISGDRYIGDITPYIYESAEYSALSSYNREYPSSRAYALKYTQGQKNITQLNFKQEHPVHEVFSKYSILNIIARKLGINPLSLSNEDIRNLQFKVKYIPIITTRVKQIKSNLEDYTFVSMLDFNQTSNKINSFAYGENMKGKLAKLGNPEISKMFLDNDLTHIPKVGQLFDDNYYISLVKTEYYPEFFKCEIALSKNYNKLNEYVGINSQKRFYEVSEKQAVDRHIIFEDLCLIGEEKNSDGQQMINDAGINKFASQFKNPIEQLNNSQIDIVRFKGYSNNYPLTSVILPINSMSAGNSIIFNFHFDDNFSAGNTRYEKNQSLLQNQVQYTNVGGKIDTAKIDFGVGSISSNDYQTSINFGNKLPKDNLVNINDVYFTTGDYQINILKDNREVINFAYQLHFMSTDNTYIIGTALTRLSTFINSKVKNWKFVLLDRKLNKFERFVETEEVAKEINDVSVETNKAHIKLPVDKEFKSWAIITEENELVLGQNKDHTNFGNNIDVYFTFTHKVV